MYHFIFLSYLRQSLLDELVNDIYEAGGLKLLTYLIYERKLYMHILHRYVSYVFYSILPGKVIVHALGSYHYTIGQYKIFWF